MLNNEEASNMTDDWVQRLFQKRMLLILMLGLASGLPLMLGGGTLQAWYAHAGVDVITIGFLGLAAQPYTYKFLWAPMVDRYRLPYLGWRRGWIATTQCILIVLLVVMATMDPLTQPYRLAFLALCLAFFAATQDIVIDAYRTELLQPEERGIGTSMAVGGYRIAMLISGGMALAMAHYIGFKGVYFLMAGFMFVGLLATGLAPEPAHMPMVRTASLLSTCWLPFKEFLSRTHAWKILAFIIFYKLGDAFASSLVTTFLLQGVGFSLLEIGTIYKTVGLGATLAGVLVGGIWMLKLGLFRSLLYFGLLQAVTNLLFYALAKVGPHYGLMLVTVFAENFAGGLGTAAYMAFVMSLCHPQFTATQFALLSALAAVGRVYVSPLSGYIVEHSGWPLFFIYSVVFAIPGLILLLQLRSTIAHYTSSDSEEKAIRAGVQEAKAEV